MVPFRPDDGVKRIREPIGEEVWTRARWMAEEWLPSANIVMDICRLKNGEFKVVEFNCHDPCAAFWSHLPLLFGLGHRNRDIG
jgi:hypothetical protein